MRFTKEELKAMMGRVRARKIARTGPMVVSRVREEGARGSGRRRGDGPKGPPGQRPEELVLTVPPMGAPRMNRADAWRKRPVVLRYREWKDEVRGQCARAGWRMKDELDVEFRVPMPPSWGAAKYERLAGRPHQQKPDIDNMCKALMDCFGEDKHIHTLTARKVWADKAAIILR